MKKILSISLVAVMLLSTLLLTSCDVASILGNFGGNFGFATTPAETTPAETTPPAPKRFTITEAEWEAILNSTNYTWKISAFSQDSVYLVTDNAAKITIKYGDDTMTAYLEYKNGVVYQINDREGNGQWVAFEVATEWSETSLGKTVGLDSVEFFEELQYNEATKSYIHEEDGEKAEFFFEDGKFVKGTIVDLEDSLYSWSVENVGTTTVTLPEYTVSDVNPNEPPAVETTYPTPDVAEPQIPDSNE